MNKKFRKRLAVGLVFLMVIGWLGGCSAIVGSGETEDELYGNVQGNIINGGNIIEYGDIILYVPNNDPSVSGKASCIYQIETDAEAESGYSMSQALELPGDYPVVDPCLCIWEDDLFILQKDNDNYESVIRKIGLNTGDIETIVSGEYIAQMQIRDGELYYLGGQWSQANSKISEAYLIRCDLDGNNPEELMLTPTFGMDGDFFFYENEEDESKDSVIYIAPHNYHIPESTIVVTNLESNEIETPAWKKDIVDYAGIDCFWPENELLYSSGVKGGLERSEGGIPELFCLNETENTIETVLSNSGAIDLGLFDNELYTLMNTAFNESRIPEVTQINLETEETVTYATDGYAEELASLYTNGRNFLYGFQVTSQGVFLTVSTYYDESADGKTTTYREPSLLYYLNPENLQITKVS